MKDSCEEQFDMTTLPAQFVAKFTYFDQISSEF